MWEERRFDLCTFGSTFVCLYVYWCCKKKGGRGKGETGETEIVTGWDGDKEEKSTYLHVCREKRGAGGTSHIREEKNQVTFSLGMREIVGLADIPTHV